MNPLHIVIVEDEVLIAMDLQESLEQKGYIIDALCDSAKDALEAVRLHMPDIVLLDIKLKGEVNGTVIAPIIQKEYGIPVVYVTSYDNGEFLNSAKMTSPYGYIVKPVTESQLYTTIEMALYRSKNENLRKKILLQDIFLGVNYRYDVINKQLYYNDEMVDLTKQELLLLDLLVKHKNNTITYKMIEEVIWSDKFITKATIRSLVRRLRDKMEENIIENVTSLGYRVMVK